MTPLQAVLLGILLFALLWVAYKIGKIILRIAAGLLFLGLAAYVVWRFLLASSS